MSDSLKQVQEELSRLATAEKPNGTVSDSQTMSEPATPKKKKPNGVSIHYLKTQFLKEVKESGKDETAMIYHLEDLNKEEHGVIRSKGAAKLCPIDGVTMGAAYVDCLSGPDDVGPADFLLSYCWQYRIGDIIECLVTYCEMNGLDQKRTYAWICCLCNNQHKVYKDRASGKNVPTEEFMAIFQGNIIDINHIMIMMTPFYDPIYIQRMYCNLEASTGKKFRCKMTLVMTAKDREDMRKGAGRIDNLFKQLGKIKIEEGKASVEADRVHILEVVEKELGGCKEVNATLCALIREWVMESLEAEVAKLGRERNEGDADDGYGELCFSLGKVMYVNGEWEKALEYNGLALEESIALNGDKEDSFRATIYNNIGMVYKAKGDYDQALVEYNKALDIKMTVHGPDNPSTATSHNNIGAVYNAKGDYDQALVEYRKALDIKMTVLGPDHPLTATSHNNIGGVYYAKGDYDQALVEYRKALDIYMTVHGPDHPSTAGSHNNIGMVYKAKGDYDQALVEYRKALDIYMTVHGPDHPSTATSHNNIGMVYDAKGDYDQALVEYRKCLDIRLTVLGSDHPSTATSHNNIGTVYDVKGDYDQALVEYRKALDIKMKVHGPDHPSTAISHNNVAFVYRAKGEYNQALVEYRKALDIKMAVFGPNHPSTIKIQRSIDIVSQKV